LDVAALASRVDPGIVDVNTTLAYQGGEAAGTGIVLTSNGEVLTNNHVINGATSISVTDVGNGKTYSATVVGYDVTADIAILQLKDASGLTTVTLGDSSKLEVGAAVVALGNAGGQGGTPSVSSGTVTALNQSITASDEADGTAEQLTGLVQTNAALQSGDSGGPLVDVNGNVVGIDTATSVSGSRSRRRTTTGGEAYAVPINTAMTVAKQIEAGKGSTAVHIGTTAFLGVQMQPSSDGSGAVVAAVEPNTAASGAGLQAGDVITSFGGKSVDSATTLSTLTQAHNAGDKVQVGWTDSSGQSHTANVSLGTGPAR
ncbi:MAG: S1C family serine protease, partial [Tepidiformaceae bacterium]